MRSVLLPLCAVGLAAMVGCEATSPNSPATNMDLSNRSQVALHQMTAQDPHLQDLLGNSVGYVIFPEIGQGAVGVGGASGSGIVFRNGQAVGTATMNQLSIGPDIGGQTYSELIIFKDEKALNRLMNDSLEFGAEAHATAVKAGAAAGTEFSNGVAVFILPKGGLEVGASLTGQKFHFTQNNSPSPNNYPNSNSNPNNYSNPNPNPNPNSNPNNPNQ